MVSKDACLGAISRAVLLDATPARSGLATSDKVASRKLSDIHDTQTRTAAAPVTMTSKPSPTASP